jgi:hypothetical protein
MADGAILIGEYEAYPDTQHGELVIGYYGANPPTIYGVIMIGSIDGYLQQIIIY